MTKPPDAPDAFNPYRSPGREDKSTTISIYNRDPNGICPVCSSGGAKIVYHVSKLIDGRRYALEHFCRTCTQCGYSGLGDPGSTTDPRRL